MPKISVIIPCYNANATIQSCLESVLQSKMKNFEIIVVDDASTDSSIDQIKKVQHQYPNKIKLLHLNKNSGPASARNKGAHEASGDSLFFLDSDTRILPSALSNFSKQIQNTDAVVGIYDKKPINSGVVPLYKALLNYYFFSRKGVIPYEVFDSSRAGIRRSVFESLRGFNETLTWGMDYENEEFGYRIVKSP
jgi:glycosyltransferase involved in cell wall biosynthesis